MDKIDSVILACLAKDARMSLKDISNHCFISAPAVSTRISHLKEAGYLTGFQAQLDAAKLGYPIKAFISLCLEPKDKQSFYPFVKSCPNVLGCDCVTGKFSQILTCRFKTTTELDEFINDLQRFGETYTQIVFSTSVEPRPLDPNLTQL
ncbi:transcriptional regulator, AsnC family [Ligilactobacillus sp. WC1T17]|uniref:Transcriptional regulator, AsnC family n=1 Tax=Ligilactobacillus ruminis TaxID=1623 RepID=A0ABY1A8Y8_9LACO|nr:transcriptional regulator, AsnC family [Ligilactobacillus ruminis]